MTFIASVIAKDGVAIIADSLVTSSKPVIDWSRFKNYLDSKDSETSTITMEVSEMIELFEVKPSHTKDYEDKLFEYNSCTAITTAGNAVINGKRISTIIETIARIDNDSGVTDITEILESICTHMEYEIKMHLEEYPIIGSTTFIITHFDKEKSKTIIYKVVTKETSKTDLESEDYVIVPIPEKPELYNIVCDGQNRISELILFGSIGTVFSVVPKVIEKLKADGKIQKDDISEDYIRDTTIHCLSKDIMEEVNISQLSELSLQQAVDLASLLMRLEMDFQKYTRNIPTVGGVIKIAVINKYGFKFVSGNEIIKPII